MGKVLPFKDNSFDAVISIAVLEHVKDPFLCAKEIVRVLKPEGELICCVPFLQSFHGYPHHYYNMTRSGVMNLFEGSLTIDQVFVPSSNEPIWALTMILNSWIKGLTNEKTKAKFLELKVKGFLTPIENLLQQDFSRELDENVKSEIGAGHMVFAHKEK